MNLVLDETVEVVSTTEKTDIGMVVRKLHTRKRASCLGLRVVEIDFWYVVAAAVIILVACRLISVVLWFCISLHHRSFAATVSYRWNVSTKFKYNVKVLS